MCSIDYCDERYAVFHKSHQKSRKDRRCSACARRIQIGESYYRTAGMTDGEWYVSSYCVHCEIACQWLTEECGGYLDGSVYEEIVEHAGEYNRIDLAKIAAGMRRQWIRFDNAWLMNVPKMPRLSKDSAKATGDAS